MDIDTAVTPAAFPAVPVGTVVSTRTDAGVIWQRLLPCSMAVWLEVRAIVGGKRRREKGRLAFERGKRARDELAVRLSSIDLSCHDRHTPWLHPTSNTEFQSFFFFFFFFFFVTEG